MRYTPVWILAVILLFAGCSRLTEFETKDFYAMGTLVSITLPAENDTMQKAVAAVNEWEKLVRAETDAINKAAVNSPVSVSESFMYLYESSLKYHEISGGRFDITIYGLTREYGFPEGPFHIPSADVVTLARKRVGQEKLVRNQNSLTKTADIIIETGAYSKGFIVDKTVEQIRKSGVHDGIVNAGGDLYAFGSKNGKPWKVGITHPDKADGFLAVLNLNNKAVVTSGNYERSFTENGTTINHIFDARTGQTANGYKSVSVIAESTENADGLSTVYFLMTPDEVRTECARQKTPVLLYTIKDERIPLCGWEQFEAEAP